VITYLRTWGLTKTKQSSITFRNVPNINVRPNDLHKAGRIDASFWLLVPRVILVYSIGDTSILPSDLCLI